MLPFHRRLYIIYLNLFVVFCIFLIYTNKNGLKELHSIIHILYDSFIYFCVPSFFIPCYLQMEKYFFQQVFLVNMSQTSRWLMFMMMMTTYATTEER